MRNIYSKAKSSWISSDKRSWQSIVLHLSKRKTCKQNFAGFKGLQCIKSVSDMRRILSSRLELLSTKRKEKKEKETKSSCHRVQMFCSKWTSDMAFRKSPWAEFNYQWRSDALWNAVSRSTWTSFESRKSTLEHRVLLSLLATAAALQIYRVDGTGATFKIRGMWKRAHKTVQYILSASTSLKEVEPAVASDRSMFRCVLLFRWTLKPSQRRQAHEKYLKRWRADQMTSRIIEIKLETGHTEQSSVWEHATRKYRSDLKR